MFENKILGFDAKGTLYPSSPLATSGRPGVETSLRKYREANNKIVVASAAQSDEDVAYWLDTWELDGFVDAYKAVGFSPGLDQYSSRGKLYRPLLDQLGIVPEEARARMVVTGDMRTDFAGDLSGVVFIYDEKGALHSLDMYEQVVETLDQAGGGDLYEGFCRRTAERATRGIDLGNKWYASLRMYDHFQHPDINGYQVPIVTIAHYPNL